MNIQFSTVLVDGVSSERMTGLDVKYNLRPCAYLSKDGIEQDRANRARSSHRRGRCENVKNRMRERWRHNSRPDVCGCDSECYDTIKSTTRTKKKAGIGPELLGLEGKLSRAFSQLAWADGSDWWWAFWASDLETMVVVWGGEGFERNSRLEKIARNRISRVERADTRRVRRGEAARLSWDLLRMRWKLQYSKGDRVEKKKLSNKTVSPDSSGFFRNQTSGQYVLHNKLPWISNCAQKYLSLTFDGIGCFWYQNM